METTKRAGRPKVEDWIFNDGNDLCPQSFAADMDAANIDTSHDALISAIKSDDLETIKLIQAINMVRFSPAVERQRWERRIEMVEMKTGKPLSERSKTDYAYAEVAATLIYQVDENWKPLVPHREELFYWLLGTYKRRILTQIGRIWKDDGRPDIALNCAKTICTNKHEGTSWSDRDWEKWLMEKRKSLR